MTAPHFPIVCDDVFEDCHELIAWSDKDSTVLVQDEGPA